MGKRDDEEDEDRDEAEGDGDESEDEGTAQEESDEPAEDEAAPVDGLPEEPAEVELVDEGEAADAIDVSPTPASAGEGASIARRDPLAAYMRDVSRYSLLKPEEEHDLAVKYVKEGDVDAARRLVTSNLRLVVKIAYDYRRAYKNLLDLIQEGNIGLMQAVKKYDPYKGVKLSSYAAWWIRAYILRYILNTHRMVKLGTTQAQRKLFFNLKKEKARLSAMGIDPTAEVIAERLDVSVDEVEQMDRRLSAGDASLDAPVGGADGRPVSRVDMLPSGGGGIDDILADAEVGDILRDKIREFGATLKGKDARIFAERLVAEDPRTLQDLGKDFGVSRERVRQLEKRLKQRLRNFLSSELSDGVLDVYE